MKWIRAELHNHTTHSDGSLTPAELAAFAAEKGFGVLALTDHNTVSGVRYLYEAIRENHHDLSVLPGVELTTFYGHILCLGLSQMVDFTSLNPYEPELFFRKLRDAGTRAIGIAHPFAIGKPILVGGRFEMEMRDWSYVDYIEVFNTSSAESSRAKQSFRKAFSGNDKALALWEELVLSGEKLAAVTGKDIHEKPAEADVFITYAQVAEEAGLPEADALIGAVLTQKTLVTKGPVFSSERVGSQVRVSFQPADSRLEKYRGKTCVLEAVDSTGVKTHLDTDLSSPLCFSVPQQAKAVVLKIYEQTCGYEHLLAVGSPLYGKDIGSI